MAVIRKLPAAGLNHLREIDRSEHITGIYVLREGRLERQPYDFHVPTWDTVGDGEHSVAHNIAAWAPLLEAGGTLYGALDDDHLAGLAIYVPNLRPQLAQLAVLHVSRPYRGSGLGRDLVEEVCAAAKADGGHRICISSAETAHTVEFYLSLGFELEPDPVLELVAKEPEDIQLAKDL